MASRLIEVIIDCTNIDRLVEFWSEVLAYDRANAGDGWVALRAPGMRSQRTLSNRGAPSGCHVGRCSGAQGGQESRPPGHHPGRPNPR